MTAAERLDLQWGYLRLVPPSTMTLDVFLEACEALGLTRDDLRAGMRPVRLGSSFFVLDGDELLERPRR